MMLTAAAAYASPRALMAQPTTVPASAPASIDLPSLVQADLQQLESTLNDARAPQEQRDAAAARLVSRPSAETRRILLAALVNLNPNGQLAVARALQQQSRPDPEFINPLFAALTGQSPERPAELSTRLAEAAAKSLAIYKGNPDVVNRLAGLTKKSPGTYRIYVIDALSTSNDRVVADALIAILKDSTEMSSIRTAAARTLGRMTGIATYQQSADLWNAWLVTMPRGELEFQSRLSAGLATRIETAETRATELAEYLKQMLTRQYLAAPAATKQEMLLTLLTDTQPDVRAIAAGLAKDDATMSGKLTAAPVKLQLRKMIGDSSPEVRQAVADAVAQINDTDSLQTVLIQLEQESDEQVQRALIFVLNQFRSVAAVPSLLKRVSDGNYSYPVQLAALSALSETGSKIAEYPDLAASTARTLLDAYSKRDRNEANREIRKAFVLAMVPLRSQELLGRVFYPIMNIQNDESPEMVRLAIRGIGELHNRDSASLILNSLGAQDSGVRLAAITALGDLSGAEVYAPQIIQRLKVETDESIKDKAWRVLMNLLQGPFVSASDLQTFADEFRNEPRKQFEIYRALRDLQIKNLGRTSTADDLFATRQNLADAAMKENEFAVAAAELKEAISYSMEADKLPLVKTDLRVRRMDALLKNRDYEGVREFAGQSFRDHPASQDDLSGKIKSRVEALRGEGKPAEAMALIREAQKIQPPLPEFYTKQLSSIEKSIQESGTPASGPGALTFPQNTPRPSPDTTASGR